MVTRFIGTTVVKQIYGQIQSQLIPCAKLRYFLLHYLNCLMSVYEYMDAF